MSPGFGEHISREVLTAAAEESPNFSTDRSLLRFQMCQELEGKLADFDGKRKTMLCIAHSAPLGRLAGVQKAEAVHVDEFAEIADVKAKSVDFVVADQVLETLPEGPHALFEQARRVIKPGGFVLVTTYMLSEVAGAPNDFWRVTPYGLEQLNETFGLEVALSGSWGNREATNAIQRGFGAAIVPDEPHPLHELATFDEPRHPIVTWVVGRLPD